jgi:ubiquinone/menaquinone biosynthesis C-methylase UbiE
MPLLQKLQKYLSTHLLSQKDTDPETAYDLWSENYDNQQDNLMLALDEEIFKIVLDIGCGTGRNWNKILNKNPQKLIGFDVSEGMLRILHKKFPEAESYRLNDHHLDTIPASYADVLISTLAIAHIEEIESAFREWNRVLRPGSDVLITDYHPAALSKGAARTFTHKRKLISVKNHVHTIEIIHALAKQFNWHPISIKEKFIDDSVRHYYEKKQALAVFEQFRGTPIIYGIHLKKSDASS